MCERESIREGGRGRHNSIQRGMYTDSWKIVHLVFQSCLRCLIQMPATKQPAVSRSNEEFGSYTLMSRDPSSLTLILLPTISAGKTRSWRMASWTAVSVRLNGGMEGE